MQSRFATLPTAVESLIHTFLPVTSHLALGATSRANNQVAKLGPSWPVALFVGSWMTEPGLGSNLPPPESEPTPTPLLPPGVFRTAPRRLTVRLARRIDRETLLLQIDTWVVPQLIGAFSGTLRSLTVSDPIDVATLSTLRHLEALDCGGVSDNTRPSDNYTDGLCSGAVTCVTLRSLAVRRLSRSADKWVQDRCLVAFPALTELDLGVVSHRTLEAELWPCSELRSLTLDGDWFRAGGSLTASPVEAVIKVLADRLPETARRLQTLIVANAQKTGAELVRYLTRFPSLTRLALTECPATDYSPLSALEALTHLDLSGCGRPTLVAKLPPAMFALRVLRMPHMSTPRALGSYPLLEELRAPSMHGLTWCAHLERLSTVCPRLRHLDLAQLAFLDEPALESLLGDGDGDGGGGGGGILPALETVTVMGPDRNSRLPFTLRRRSRRARTDTSVPELLPLPPTPFATSSVGVSSDSVSFAQVCEWSGCGSGGGLTVTREPDRTVFDQAPSSNY